MLKVNQVNDFLHIDKFFRNPERLKFISYPAIFSSEYKVIDSHMTETSGFLNYTGPVDYNRINLLLNDLKQAREFMILDKVTGRRVYAIVVECLENIIKYSAKEFAGELNIEPAISVIRQYDKIVIKTGNTIKTSDTSRIVLKIDEINCLGNRELNAMFVEKIKKTREHDDKGAGLGLILMKLKSGNKIVYDVSRMEGDLNYLELTISVNEYLQ